MTSGGIETEAIIPVFVHVLSRSSKRWQRMEMRELTLVQCETMSDMTNYEWVTSDGITPEVKERLTPETADFLHCSGFLYYVRTKQWYV